MDEEANVKDLKEVKEIFDKVGVTFWLDSGTLLGAVRDGKMIEWDADVDLGTWYSNIDKIVSAFPIFKERKFQVAISERYGSVTIRPARKDFVVGVYLFRRAVDCAWTLFPLNNTKIQKLWGWCMDVLSLETYTIPEEQRFIRKTELFLNPLPLRLRRFMADMIWSIMDRCDCIIPWVIPKRYFEELSTIEFYSMEFKVPSNVGKYLEYHYGSDWKTPNRNWACLRDDGAVNRNFKQKIVKEIRLKH